MAPCPPARADRVPGLSASFAALLTVEPGNEAALAPALGVLADAVAVSDVDGAQAAIALLKAEDSGRAALIIGGSDLPPKGDRPAFPEGARWALDVVGSPDHLRPAVVRLLQDVVFAPDLDTARTIVSYAPELRAVTPAGDLLGAYTAVGGSAKQPSFIEVQAAVEEARQNRNARRGPHRPRCRSSSRPVRAQLTAAKQAVEQATAVRREAESQRNAVGRRHGRAQGQAGHRFRPQGRMARNQGRSTGRVPRPEQARDRDLAGLRDL